MAWVERGQVSRGNADALQFFGLNFLWIFDFLLLLFCFFSFSSLLARVLSFFELRVLLLNFVFVIGRYRICCDSIGSHAIWITTDICMHIAMHTHTYIDACTYAYTHIYAHVCIHLCIHSHTHTHARALTHPALGVHPFAPLRFEWFWVDLIARSERTGILFEY